MQLLGIDYGLKKTGIALAATNLAEPYTVIRLSGNPLLEKIVNIIDKEEIQAIVVGISEGDTAKKTREFVKNLRSKLDVPIYLHDETLSTQEAQRRTIQAGMQRKKRKNREDSYAATIMLQSYLDSVSL